MPTARILVVDDDQDVRDLVVATLSGAGYRTEAVGGGRAAIAAAAAVELIVLDVEMPDLDGLAVCAAVRDGERDRPAGPCRILMLSAAGTAADRAAGFAAGADDYLIKPFSPRELLERIAALISAPAVPAG